jgi:cyclomaltodextrinase / maltogenic alpha-amylase / neopullulanase
MPLASTLLQNEKRELASCEPKWVEHSIWWHIYPIGFLGAPQTADAGLVNHRMRTLLNWLDYAVELGVSGILLGPIFSSSTHGYDTTDYFTIDPRLGDRDDFVSFVEAAHRRGLRILLDGVFNHVGRDFPAFKRVANDSNNAGADSNWFRKRRDADSLTGELEYETFEGHDQLIALNHANAEVVSFVTNIMCHWLEAGIDGWRLDAAYAVPSDFWASVIAQVRHQYPNAYFAAEVLHGDYASIVKSAGFDCVTQYELWKALWSSINDRNWFELAWALDRNNSYLDTFKPLTFVGNHDVTRIASQIQDSRHLEHVIVLLFTLGGTPCIYYGDEQAFIGIKEHRVGGDDAIRPSFPHDGPTALAHTGWPFYRLHQRLIGFRRRHSWLHSSRTKVLHLTNHQFVFQSYTNDGSITVALNLSDEPLKLAGSGSSQQALGDRATESGNDWIIPPHRWAVFA